MALTRINNQALTNVTSAGLPSGSVIQVKTDKFNSEKKDFDTGSATNGDEFDGLSVAITPTTSSSKFYVHYSGGGMIYNTNTQDVGVILKAIYNSTTYEIQRIGMYKADNTWSPTNFGISTLHEPATSSQITYKIFFFRDGGNGDDLRVNRGGGDSTLTVMEIAG